MLQWLRFCVSNAGSVGSIPGWGTKILTCPVAWQKSKKKFEKLTEMKELNN